MTTGIEHYGAGAHRLCHAAVMIQGMDKPANFQNRLAHRFTLFFGQECGKFFFLLKNCVSSSEQNCATLGWSHGGPLLERGLRDVDRSPDIVDGAFGHGVDDFTSGRIADFCGLPLSESTCTLATNIFAMMILLILSRKIEKNHVHRWKSRIRAAVKC